MRVSPVMVVLLVAGCGGIPPPQPLPLVGKFNDRNETMTGEIRVVAEGRTFITLRTRESKLYCEGSSRLTYGVPLVGRVGCGRSGGIILLECGDGRRLTADYHVTSCTSGEATGSDNTGARFSLVYGLPATDGQQYLASAEAELAGKPSLNQASRGGGSGTGFLISADGLIVTNHHVIDGANTIEVHHGSTNYTASVIARDPANDLAILKTNISGRPLRLASARGSMRGDDVLTLGYPLTGLEGESQKATFGRINATSGIKDDARYLQIDIPTQPGNSGGPLLNRRGEVIGVVSMGLNSVAVLETSGALPQNVNYAIKADYISILLPPSASTPSASLANEIELSELVDAVEESVVRIVTSR